MTFPKIDPEIAERAAVILAGEGASRAALFTAQQHTKFVVDALQRAVNESAPREDWRTGEGRQRIAEGVGVSYQAAAKLERESGGDKSEVWTVKRNGEDLGNITTHDHAMCDPDRNCGPDETETATGTYPLHTGIFKQAIDDFLETPLFEHARQPRPRLWTMADHNKLMDDLGCEVTTDFSKVHVIGHNTTGVPDWLAEARLKAAAELKEAEALKEKEAAARFFPGGRMWAEHTEGGEDECCRDESAICDAPADDCAGAPPHDPYTAPEDKLRIIADVVNAQAPLGSDLADFRRRLLLILGMQ